MNPLAWLNPGRWLIYLGLALALWFGYHAWTERQRETGREEIRAQFVREAQAAEAQRAVVTQVVERAVVRRVQNIQVITETIIKEVPVYVQADAPDLPAGWRLLHDAAARGEVPDPAALAHAAPADAADAANTVAGNYGTCRKTAERLMGLQQWVQQQQAM